MLELKIERELHVVNKFALPTLEEWKELHLLQLWAAIAMRLEAEHDPRSKHDPRCKHEVAPA